jgi:hypothetical protein
MRMKSDNRASSAANRSQAARNCLLQSAKFLPDPEVSRSRMGIALSIPHVHAPNLVPIEPISISSLKRHTEAFGRRRMAHLT